MVRPLFELVCALCQVWAPGPGGTSPRTTLPAELSLAMPAAIESAETPFSVPRTRVPKPRAPASLGDRWSLSDGRALSIYLTPSPERCAPWMEMRF